MAAQIICKNHGYSNKLKFCDNQLDGGFCWFSTPTDQYNGGCLKLLAVMQIEPRWPLTEIQRKKLCSNISLNK